MSTPTRRTLPAEAKILNEKDRTCRYVASDQTIDCYREIVRAAGWKFDRFQLNAPFVDSHNYSSVGFLLGNVRAWRIEGASLMEDVQFIPEGVSPLADFAWKMSAAKFLRAVSVGFLPQRTCAPWRDPKDFANVCAEMGIPTDIAAQLDCIHYSQDQTELSAVLIGANPSAVAKAHKAGAVTDADFAKLGVDDDGLTFLHEAAAGYDTAGATLRMQLRKELKSLFKLSVTSPANGQPAGNTAQHAAAAGNETRAARRKQLVAAMRSAFAGQV